MKDRFKKQRNMLIQKIILIMLAVWLITSAVFCAVRLNMEKTNIQNRELTNLAHAKQVLIAGNGSFEAVNRAFLESTDFINNNNISGSSYNSQFIITDRITDKLIADTAGTIAVRFSVKQGDDSAFDVIGLLDYDLIQNALSEAELDEIIKLLNTKRDDGNYYELICTKLQMSNSLFIPLELKIVLVNGTDTRFTLDDNVAVFGLEENKIKDNEMFYSSDIKRNTIPTEFITDKKYNPDLISLLSKEEKDQATAVVSAGGLDVILYASDFLNYDNSSYDSPDDDWVIQYAKRANLFDSCKFDLAIGVCMIFLFILIIAVILCVMIWHNVKAQNIQEQKRLDLTNKLAHDIKTPVFVISGYAYSLKEDIDRNERDFYIDNIIEEADEINDLVQKMLNFSKLDSYTMKLNKTEFDLFEAVQKTAEKYTALPENKTIALTQSGDNMICADRELMETVIQNLIDNAVKYSLPETEITIEVNGNTLSVSNQTEPLTKSELKQLWQPYYRKDKSRSKKGNGLGLSIVKSILDLHEAKYIVEMTGNILTITVKTENI